MGALTPEGKVKAKLVKILKELDAFYFFPPSNGYGKAGIPDVICCIAGKFVGIEVKSAVGKLTSLQAQMGEKIHRAGGSWVVVRNDDDIIALAARIRILQHVGRTEHQGASPEAQESRSGP